MKRVLILFLVLLFFIGGEFFLRKQFGFTDAVLFQVDPQMEYIAAPNQNRIRFGNSIRYNEFSMRSEPLKDGSRRILGMGDSILNGGTLCDQESLTSYLLEKNLRINFDQNIQVLNLSAPSWGPDNVMAYLKKFGDFDAEILFLVTSSHDVYDTMEYIPVVGINKNYPEKQYSLAYVEGVDRYLIPWLGKNLKGNKNTSGGFEDENIKAERNINTGFQQIYEYTKQRDLPFILYLHPERSEVNKGKYNNKGQVILEFAKKNNIILVTGLPGAKESHYIDEIHLNEEGQQYMFKRLYHSIKDFI